VSDLTTQEQERVRAALRFLRVRVGAVTLVRALRADAKTLRRILGGHTVNASLAFRVAKMASVGIGELLAGAFPPAGACPHCGHVTEATK
jgi:hypothetical protein